MCNPNQKELDLLAQSTLSMNEAQLRIDEARFLAANNPAIDDAYRAQLALRQAQINRQRATVKALKAHYETFH